MMSQLRRLVMRLVSAVRPGRADRELTREMATHLRQIEDDCIRRGMSAPDARAAAVRAFGGVEQAKEVQRDARSIGWIDELRQNVKYAVRTLRRTPGFTLAAVLTLALGIGANTLMFSVVNATLLQPVAFPDADRLVTVWKGRVADPEHLNIVSMPNYRDYRERSRSFESIALLDSTGRGYNLTGRGEAEQVPGVRVTASFFRVLGVSPQLGRTFLQEEEQTGNDGVVVLSHGLWTRRYGADPSLVGQTIQIDSQPRVVVGVMPASFTFRLGVVRQLWVPVGWTKGDEGRTSNSFIAIARLKPTVTLQQSRSEMDTLGRALAAQHAPDDAGFTVRLAPFSEFGARRLRSTLVPMMAVVGFVLLIACVNVANLMLARGAARARELAIRCTLGAGHGRIVRQLLTESVVLACAGAAAGLVLAYWGTSALVPILPNNLRTLPFRASSTVGIDVTVLAFTSALAIGSGILFGLIPAFASFRNDLTHPLKENARGSTGDGKSRLRYGLVAAEVALTLVVLAGAGVMLVSVARLLGVSPGLDPRNVLVMEMSVPQANLYYGPPGNPRFCESIGEQVGSIPGVLSVSAVGHLPLSGGSAGRGLAIEGRPDPGPENQPDSAYSVACPGILKTLGISLLKGREFTHRDTLEAPGVVLVNEALAKQQWPGEDAIGKRFKIGRTSDDAPWLTVVGVYKDFRQFGLDSEQGPSFYRPYQQAGWPLITIVVKTVATPEGFTAAVRRAIAVVEPNQPASGGLTMDQIIGSSVSSRRVPMLLLSGFALLALVLAAVGIAGVVGYSVVQRTPEIGVRVALGAQRRDVLRLILGHSLAWALGGVVVGIVGSVGLLRLLGTLLYDVTPTDPIVLLSVSLVLIGVVLAASYVPARRAVRVDAVTALRQN
jgi:putative ABC transport system permease protein